MWLPQVRRSSSRIVGCPSEFDLNWDKFYYLRYYCGRVYLQRHYLCQILFTRILNSGQILLFKILFVADFDLTKILFVLVFVYKDTI